MLTQSDHHHIQSEAQLTALFGPVGPASLRKEVSYLHQHYQAMIAASPFAALATSGPGGLDVSPRGDPPGFVVVRDAHTLIVPERRGNNRIDSLRNIVHDPRVALLFLIPGVGETLRVNGRAAITTDPALLESLAMEDKLPLCAIVVTVETVFFQCARAIKRSKLWGSAQQQATVPSAGTILTALSNSEIDGEKYDRELPARQKATLY